VTSQTLEAELGIEGLLTGGTSNGGLQGKRREIHTCPLSSAPTDSIPIISFSLSLLSKSTWKGTEADLEQAAQRTRAIHRERKKLATH
jgi:hypothetical protein